MKLSKKTEGAPIHLRGNCEKQSHGKTRSRDDPSDAYKIAESERNKILEKAQSEVADMIAAATEKLVLGSSTSESYDQFLTAVERGGENETGKQ